jgi:acyl-CoA thioesterase
MTFPALAPHDGGFTASVDETWLQGRTCYGGLSAALALMAAKAAYPDLPPLRSAQIAFIGPLIGNVQVTPTLLRRGKNSAFVSCDVAAEGGIGLRALLLFMTSRKSAITHHDLTMPPVGRDEAALLDARRVPQGFLGNFDIMPWEKDQATIRAWRRLKDRHGLDPEVELLAIADALPPAAMALAKDWGPISTTTWQLNLVTDAPATRDGWWLLEAKALDAANGNSSQVMTIWNADGAAVATATQSVALFI